MDYRTLALYIQSCYTESEVRWSRAKDEKLRQERGASFLELLGARVIDVQDNPRKPHQQLAVVEFRNYAWVVAFVARGDEVFLKTAYPSRAQLKSWKGGRPT